MRFSATSSAMNADIEVPNLRWLDPGVRTLKPLMRASSAACLTGVSCDDAGVAVPNYADAPFSLGLLWPFDRPRA